MMIKLKKTYLILFICFLSCKYDQIKPLDGADTTKIFQSIFDSKSFVKENICSASDSIYLLKNKYYNKYWPKKSNYFNILSINNTPQARMLNFGPNAPYDGRTRVSILKFHQKTDTVYVLIQNHGPDVFFEYNLIKKDNLWTILTEHFETGGRRAYYGFEKDQWYLDLKKKIKKTDEYDSFKPKRLK